MLMKSPSFCLLIVSLSLGFFASGLQAREILLHRGFGNYASTKGSYTSEISMGRGSSSTSLKDNQVLGSGRGAVTAFHLNGKSAGANEYATIQVAKSPHLATANRVWHADIVPGRTRYLFRAQIYVPTSTTMRARDRVQLTLRFLAADNDASHQVTRQSHQYTGATGGWVQAEIEGTVPARDRSGSPIALIAPIVTLADMGDNARDGVFAYVDRLDLKVFVEGPPARPARRLTRRPSTLDQDRNGYSDVWEAVYNASDLPPQGDADKDGVTNLEESRMRTNPRSAASVIDPYFVKRSARNGQIRWKAPPMIGGRVVTSTSLDPGTWTAVDQDPRLVGREFRQSVDLQRGSGFYRVEPIEIDSDRNQIPDWMEDFLGFKNRTTSPTVALPAHSYDGNGDGKPEKRFSPELVAFNEMYFQPSPDAQPSKAQAARLLMQASFGPTPREIAEVQKRGLAGWVDWQLKRPKSHLRHYIRAIKHEHSGAGNNPNLNGYHIVKTSGRVSGRNVKSAWFRTMINAEDQLRMRVAWALSQIFVVSRNAGALSQQPEAMTNFYDILVDESFGNFEDLLYKVALNPVMGTYLSSLQSRKADPSVNQFPDENFAREIMQLFSIGLWELNLNGTRKLDRSGEPIPTYDNGDITTLARVFTGLGHDAFNFNRRYQDDGPYMLKPMKIYPEYHDYGRKSLLGNLVIRGRHFSEGDSGVARSKAGLAEIRQVAAFLTNHPSAAPFICKQLIQFLVTDNPSPGYVARVATVFRNDGSGVAGNLSAVVRAILLDREARNPSEHLSTKYFGKLREPTIRVVHLCRLFNLKRFKDLIFWDFGSYNEQTLQAPLASPSVFNYYRPDYQSPGVIADRGLTSSTFQILNSFSSVSFPNYAWSFLNDGLAHSRRYSFKPEFSQIENLSTAEMLEFLSVHLCAGALSASSRAIIAEALTAEGLSREERARLAAFLVAVSPEAACQK